MIDAIGARLPTFAPVAQPQDAPFVGNLAPSTPELTQPSDFTSMLTGMITDTANAVKTAESTSVAAVHGSASIQQVAEAVYAAEMTLQGAIAVRDKITAAYLELSHMAI
jgi:flagellar hook-basal body complex protein FliE